jgi:hypothetical protein
LPEQDRLTCACSGLASRALQVHGVRRLLWLKWATAGTIVVKTQRAGAPQLRLDLGLHALGDSARSARSLADDPAVVVAVADVPAGLQVAAARPRRLTDRVAYRQRE